MSIRGSFTKLHIMIKASDLRIGNKLLFDGSILTVKAIFQNGDDHFNIASMEGKILDISNSAGVPLTPETLEKCGFEECDKSEYRDVTAVPGTGW